MISFYTTPGGRFLAEHDDVGNVRLAIEGRLEDSCPAGSLVRFVAKLTSAQLARVVRECIPNTARIREVARQIVEDDNQIEAAELLELLACLLDTERAAN